MKGVGTHCALIQQVEPIYRPAELLLAVHVWIARAGKQAAGVSGTATLGCAPFEPLRKAQPRLSCDLRHRQGATVPGKRSPAASAPENYRGQQGSKAARQQGSKAARQQGSLSLRRRIQKLYDTRQAKARIGNFGWDHNHAVPGDHMRRALLASLTAPGTGFIMDATSGAASGATDRAMIGSLTPQTGSSFSTATDLTSLALVGARASSANDQQAFVGEFGPTATSGVYAFLADRRFLQSGLQTSTDYRPDHFGLHRDRPQRQQRPGYAVQRLRHAGVLRDRPKPIPVHRHHSGPVKRPVRPVLRRSPLAPSPISGGLI